MIHKTSTALATVVVALACVSSVYAKSLTELKHLKIDTDHVDCKSGVDVIDECGLQQAWSYRHKEFGYPLNHTSLLTSCKRQFDALKCLRAYSKCLPPLSKQVLLAMVNGRQRYQKKVCSEKPSESAQNFVRMNQCIASNKLNTEKGVRAELEAITVPMSIASSKIDNLQDRIKYSCCNVAKNRREFLDTTRPNCNQHEPAAAELIDSFLEDTVGIICPPSSDKNCDKLPKLAVPKSTNFRFFVRPILDVVQTLA